MNAKGLEYSTLTLHESSNADDGLHKNTSTELANKFKGIYENRELLFAIVHQSSNAIVITDSQRNIQYANKKFEEISGYALNDVLGQNPRILQSKKTPIITYQKMNLSLSQGHTWKGEFTNIHKNGREYIEEAVISAVRNETGQIVYYLAEKTDITALKRAQNEIYTLAYYDTLTGLPNRTYFIKCLKKKIDISMKNSSECFSVLFADLNRFKDINDTYGHSSGDSALEEVARRFKGVISAEDILARIGGDEFVLLHQHTSTSSAYELAQRLSDSLLAPISINDHDHCIGVSIGSATYPVDGDSVKQLLQYADIAMYDAKASKYIYSAYRYEVGAQSQRVNDIAHRLERLVDKNQLYLVYQPKVDLSTGQMVGAEALLRWSEPELGEVSPAEFIPIAERCGQMNTIGVWVIKKACNQLKEWEQNGLALPGCLAINLSIQQLEHPDFHEQLLTIVESVGVSPSQIELEVTESVLMSNPEHTSETLASLVNIGFTIAIDDFGTGYSSLAYLKDINASVLKIDRSFIKSISPKTNVKTIIESIVKMAHNLGMNVVAEGVEQQMQASYLSSINCDMAQGFFYSHPLTANKFELMLNDQI